MRRVRRILWNVATAGSLVLCVAAAGMWVRGYWWTDRYRPIRDRPTHGVTFMMRRVHVAWRSPRLSPTLLQRPARPWESRASEPAERLGAFLGFGHESYMPPDLFIESFHGMGFSVSWMTRNDAPPDSFSAFTGAPSAAPGTVLGVSVGVPYYSVCLASAILPAVRIRRVLRRRRRPPAGHCPACGYDCRATPDRCPECGGRVATAPAPP